MENTKLNNTMVCGKMLKDTNGMWKNALYNSRHTWLNTK